MREEEVTLSLLSWLKNEKWFIISFDYPGSGTGIRIHKNGTRFKNKDTIVPDIIAVNGEIALFFENKDHFCLKDFQKQYSNIHEGLYSDDVDRILAPYNVKKCLWGIGMPDKKYNKHVNSHEWMVDFLMCVAEDKTIQIKKAFNFLLAV